MLPLKCQCSGEHLELQIIWRAFEGMDLHDGTPRLFDGRHVPCSTGTCNV
jgi:hypothetical protein